MKRFFKELGLIKEEFVEKINWLFGKWGEIVYNHAYLVILGSLLVCAGCCIGLIPPIPKWVDGAENLYALPQSLARDHGAIHRSLFQDSYARQNFVVVKSASDPHANIFTWEFLNVVRQLDRMIRGKVVDPVEGRRIAIQRPIGFSSSDEDQSPEDKKRQESANEDDSSTNRLGSEIISPRDDRGDASQDVLTFQDICLKVSNGQCSVQSILEMGVFDIGTKLTPPDAPPEIYVFDGLVVSPEVRGFVPGYLMGEVETVPCERNLPKALVENFVPPELITETANPLLVRAPTTCVVSASAFMMVYDLKDDKDNEEINMRWEKVLIDIVKDNEIFGPASVSINAFRSRDDELRASTSESSDILFVILTFIILIAYASSLNFSCDLYRSKSFPALAGAGAALLGLISGLGFVCLVGVAFVPTALICPFLVMGIGVDDMFVIVNAYSLAYTVDSARSRVATALRDSGLSITITTSTNLIAFFVGAFSPYLSIRNFCLFSAAGLFMGYFYCLTFFFAFLCIDAKREEAMRVCFFCLPKYTDKELLRAHESNQLSQHPSTGNKCSSSAPVLNEISTFSLVSFKARTAARQSTINEQTLNPDESQLRGYLTSKDVNPQSTSETVVQPRRRRSSYLITALRRCVQRFYSPKRSNLIDGARPQYEDSFNQIPPRKQRLPQNIHLQTTSPGSSFNSPDSAECPNHEHGAYFDRGCMRTPPIENGSQWKQGARIHQDLSISDISLGDQVDHQTLKLAENVYLEEPAGNVGRMWRSFFLHKYGPFLMKKYVKVAVLIIFAIYFGISAYGFAHLKQGLELKALSPDSSYLQKFDADLERYFQLYDVPVELFFPDGNTEWHSRHVQRQLYTLDKNLKALPSTKLMNNPMIRMLEDEELTDRLTSGDKEVFERTLFNELSIKGGKFKQFERDFVWQGSNLVGWKFVLLPAFMKESEDRALWMKAIRSVCSDMLNYSPPLEVYPYTYMMVYYESDLGIMKSVMLNMGVAAVAMLLIAFLLISQMTAGLLVIVTMALIDIGLFGFMYYWDVRLNMVSMINLVISIGFAVDYSAHMCHTFTHCEGSTRDLRAVETLVLMGSPVFHGAFSTLLGVFMLGLSSSYIFRVFFKMFLLVVVFGLLHGVILLPVLLSLIGSMKNSGHGQPEPLEIQLARRTGASIFSYPITNGDANCEGRLNERGEAVQVTTSDCTIVGGDGENSVTEDVDPPGMHGGPSSSSRQQVYGEGDNPQDVVVGCAVWPSNEPKYEINPIANSGLLREATDPRTSFHPMQQSFGRDNSNYCHQTTSDASHVERRLASHNIQSSYTDNKRGHQDDDRRERVHLTTQSAAYSEHLMSNRRQRDDVRGTWPSRSGDSPPMLQRAGEFNPQTSRGSVVRQQQSLGLEEIQTHQPHRGPGQQRTLIRGNVYMNQPKRYAGPRCYPTWTGHDMPNGSAANTTTGTFTHHRYTGDTSGNRRAAIKTGGEAVAVSQQPPLRRYVGRTESDVSGHTTGPRHYRGGRVEYAASSGDPQRGSVPGAGISDNASTASRPFSEAYGPAPPHVNRL